MDISTSPKFNRHNDKYSECMSFLNSNKYKLEQNYGGSEFMNAYISTLNKARDNVELMKEEMTELSSNEKRRLQLFINKYDAEISCLVSVVKDHSSRYTDGGVTQKLLSDDERLETHTNQIQDAYKTVLNTQEVSNSILSQLKQQRERLQYTSRSLGNVNQDMDKSSKASKDMLRRLSANKFLSFLIVVLLLCIMMMVLYIKITG